jgi:hypothetical protein
MFPQLGTGTFSEPGLGRHLMELAYFNKTSGGVSSIKPKPLSRGVAATLSQRRFLFPPQVSPSNACVLTFLRGVPLHFHPLERAEGGREARGGRDGLGIGARGRGCSLEGSWVAVGWLFETRRDGARLAEGRVIHLAAEQEGATAGEDGRGGVVDVRPAVVGCSPERSREVVRGPGPQEAIVRASRRRRRRRCGAPFVGPFQGTRRVPGRGRG